LFPKATILFLNLLYFPPSLGYFFSAELLARFRKRFSPKFRVCPIAKYETVRDTDTPVF
jgi:hypothetical protein